MDRWLNRLIVVGIVVDAYLWLLHYARITGND